MSKMHDFTAKEASYDAYQKSNQFVTNEYFLLSKLNKKINWHTWVPLSRFKYCYSVIAEVEGNDEGTVLVNGVICQHFAHKSKYITLQTLPVV